jgi:surfeit locus 1 family protein
VSAAQAAGSRRRLGVGFWGFILFMLVLTAIFVALGVWQVERLAWKEGLIAEVSARFTQPPYDLPSADQWPSLDLETYDFHPVTTTGQFEPDKTLLVFTSLSDPKGRYSGPGYWVMTPFAPNGGGTVFVNRGFIPQANSASFADGQGTPSGQQTITGVAVAAEEAGAFTPAPDTAHKIEWVRDPARLATLAGVSGPLLGVSLDMPATTPGALPQGGETIIDFPNNHFGYALTWFGFAILTPALLAFWVYRQLKPKPEAPYPPPSRGG